MSWNHKDEFEIKFKEDIVIRESFNRIYKFNKGDILTGLADGYCGCYDDENGYISIITYEDRKKLETINVYYKYMEYIINKTSNEYISLMNKAGITIENKAWDLTENDIDLIKNISA